MEADKLREKLLSLRASRAGSLAFLSRTQKEFENVLLSPGTGNEVMMTKAKAAFDKALEHAKISCRKVLTTASAVDFPEFNSDKEEALSKEKEVDDRGKAINALHDDFTQTLLEVSSSVNEPEAFVESHFSLSHSCSTDVIFSLFKNDTFKANEQVGKT